MIGRLCAVYSLQCWGSALDQERGFNLRKISISITGEGLTNLHRLSPPLQRRRRAEELINGVARPQSYYPKAISTDQININRINRAISQGYGSRLGIRVWDSRRTILRCRVPRSNS